MFPCPAGCVLSLREEEQQQQQEQQEGSMSHCTNSGIKICRKPKNLVQNYCFSRVSEGTLGTFWARFWRCSVLQGHCVSLSGRVRFQPREEEQQQQQEQQEGSMSHCTNSGIKIGRKPKTLSKTIVFLGFQKGR